MHGRIKGALTLGILSIATGCSSNVLMKPDCHSCTVEEQRWKDFSWAQLEGRWKGSVENLRNQQGKEKARTEKVAELNFLSAKTFLQSRGGVCKSLPENALVLNGQFWESGSAAKEYEAFVPVEDGKVAYGRVTVEKLNGRDVCHFRRFGRVMGQNRLALPAVGFSNSVVNSGRALASLGAEQDINVEFLRFAPKDKAPKAFASDGRKPASVKEQERPTLILRVFKVSALANKDRGEWSGTEEYIYRLWKKE